jgi:hypothetical protein
MFNELRYLHDNRLNRLRYLHDRSNKLPDLSITFQVHNIQRPNKLKVVQLVKL